MISSARFEGNNAKYYSYNKDTRNSTSTLVGDDNVGIVAYKYDEFGETEKLGNESLENEVCYTGQMYDKETGDYYYNARYYSPDEGRFVTVDTYRGEFEEPLSLHLYTYCANNPVNYTDPSGHSAVWLYAPTAVIVDGHVGLIAKRAKNAWRYLSYGTKGAQTPRGDLADKKVNSLKNINKNVSRSQHGAYKQGIKFYGGFKNTISNFDSEAKKKYNVINHNCVQVAGIAMSKGNFTKSDGDYHKTIRKEIRDKFRTLAENFTSPRAVNTKLKSFLKNKRYKGYWKKFK